MGNINLNLAIDSMPLGRDIFDSFDYSGLQIYSLTRLSLHKVTNEFTSVNGENKTKYEVAIPQNRYWSDGTAITPHHYLNGIKKVLTNNPFVKIFLFRNVKSISIFQGKIYFELLKKNYKFLDILSIPNFSPFKDDSSVVSGNFVIEQSFHNGFTLRRNELYESEINIDRLKISLIKDPGENYKYFKTGMIDYTADTAFCFDKVINMSNRDNLFKSNTGLYSVVKIGKKLSGPDWLEIRLRVKAIIQNINFDSITFGYCQKIIDFYSLSPLININGENYNFQSKKPISNASLRSHHPLTLHYDNYYPNYKICSLISKKLKESGIEVNLVEDNYENPSLEYDLRFSIIRGLSVSNYLIYCSFLFSEVLMTDKASQKEYLQIINEIESGRDNELFSFGKLQNILDREAVIVPLFRVPSIFYSRFKNINNPLIEVFKSKMGQVL